VINLQTVIKVLGLGGGGSNAVDRMIQFGIEGVEFIAANTDAQDLAKSEARKKLLLGRTPRGLGAGGNPANGECAAEESENAIREAVRGADVVFLAAGMGGGTGTGSIPVAARIAREEGAITVAVVSTPFAFEGKRRSQNAQAGIAKLREQCHSLIVVPNDKLLSIVDRSVTLDQSLRVANEVLRQGVQAIAELVTRPSVINVDFANVCSLMQMPGGAFLAIGTGKGANKAVDAVNETLRHKLLEPDTLAQASGVLVHFTGGNDLGLFEINQAMEMVRRAVQPETQTVFGVMVDENMTGLAQVILVATGVGANPIPASRPETARDAAEPDPAPAPEPEPALARSLFANAAGQAQSVKWVMPEEAIVAGAPAPAMIADDLDVPAFLRRRRAGL